MIQTCNLPSLPSISASVCFQMSYYQPLDTDHLLTMPPSPPRGPNSDELSKNASPATLLPHIPRNKTFQGRLVGPRDTYILIAHIPVWPLPK